MPVIAVKLLIDVMPNLFQHLSLSRVFLEKGADIRQHDNEKYVCNKETMNAVHCLFREKC